MGPKGNQRKFEDIYEEPIVQYMRQRKICLDYLFIDIQLNYEATERRYNSTAPEVTDSVPLHDWGYRLAHLLQVSWKCTAHCIDHFVLPPEAERREPCPMPRAT